MLTIGCVLVNLDSVGASTRGTYRTRQCLKYQWWVTGQLPRCPARHESERGASLIPRRRAVALTSVSARACPPPSPAVRAESGSDGSERPWPRAPLRCVPGRQPARRAHGRPLLPRDSEPTSLADFFPGLAF